MTNAGKKLITALATPLIAALFGLYAFVFAKDGMDDSVFALSFACAALSFIFSALAIAYSLYTKEKLGKKLRTRTALVGFFFALYALASGLVVLALRLKDVIVPLIAQGVPLVLYAVLMALTYTLYKREAPAPDELFGDPPFPRAIESEIRAIAQKCTDQHAREHISSVEDALIFSDTLSNFETASCEDAIVRYVNQLDSLDDYSDAAKVESICEAIHIQIDRRNEICARCRELGT